MTIAPYRRGCSGELGRPWAVSIARQPDGAQPVVGEHPQREEVRRLLDEHDITWLGQHRQQQVEPTRAASGDDHVLGRSRAVRCAEVRGDRGPRVARAAGEAVRQRLPLLGRRRCGRSDVCRGKGRRIRVAPREIDQLGSVLVLHIGQATVRAEGLRRQQLRTALAVGHAPCPPGSNRHCGWCRTAP